MEKSPPNYNENINPLYYTSNASHSSSYNSSPQHHQIPLPPLPFPPLPLPPISKYCRSPDYPIPMMPNQPRSCTFINPMMTAQPRLYDDVTQMRTPQPQVKRSSTRMICPYCRADIKTSVVSKTGTLAKVYATIMCLVGGLMCCCCVGLIPYYMLQHKKHFCPSCDSYIGEYDPYRYYY